MACVQVKRVFLEFSQFGTRSEAKTMDVYRFTKLCRECDLLPHPHDTPSINLIFYKVSFSAFFLSRCLLLGVSGWSHSATTPVATWFAGNPPHVALGV